MSGRLAGRAGQASAGLAGLGGPVSGRTLTGEAGAAGSVDPVLLEIIAGSLASIEREVETAIGRTARSPMIRDAHDFRAGIHDRLLRKLTGRSYSALVHPVVRDFPIETMRPGDVFFHNDVYLSEGGIGHLPDLCVTVPVFHDGAAGLEAPRGPGREAGPRASDGPGLDAGPGAPDGPRVVAFVQAFGHHDDIGGSVPGSMPSHATSVFEEGLMVPPIRLWDAGTPNRAVLTIMTRNSRMPSSLAADLDAECAACLMGARRLAELFDRYGRHAVEACFDAIVAGTTRTFRREILAKIPAGSWTWEDYAEHDGVDEPRLHRQRITLTKTGEDEPGGPKLIMDFAGTGPQAKGPINHCANYADGNFLAKWLAPILRNLADTPERMAELDVNEGVVDLIEMRFPPPGTLLTPVFPAPTNARTFVILRLLGVLAGVLAKAVDGRMPADQETIRYTGVYGTDARGEPYLMREVLGGGSGGRYYADGEDTIHVVPDSRNLPAEFSEARFPFLVERLGLAVDSGGPGQFRGGLGYDKQIRMLADGYFMSIADRSILSCWGVNGGRAGRSFSVTIDPGGPAEREVEALADAEFVPAGTLIRIRTTGGGGWGDPLDRDIELVVRDVAWGKVSRENAAADYGVVITGDPGLPAGEPGASPRSAAAAAGAGAGAGAAVGLAADIPATLRLRERMRAARPGRRPFFDRGPGYARLAGMASAEVDWL
ncbi:MAG TPA: hydantoinase B/oxoprolinase family protein [Streptosporangiaceae bacterium]|nr:hydantoinase B/oxoprolinase family protein [Streptosporangiaceae bacterium]